LDQFKQKDEDEYFRDLASLKKKTTMKAYVAEFHKIVVMVTNIAKKRLTFLFLEGLLEPLRGLVKAFVPPSLQEAIQRELLLEPSTLRSTLAPKSGWTSHRSGLGESSKHLQRGGYHDGRSTSHPQRPSASMPLAGRLDEAT